MKQKIGVEADRRAMAVVFLSYRQKLSLLLFIAAVAACCRRKFVCEHMLAWPWCDALVTEWSFWSSAGQQHFAWDNSPCLLCSRSTTFP